MTSGRGNGRDQFRREGPRRSARTGRSPDGALKLAPKRRDSAIGRMSKSHQFKLPKIRHGNSNYIARHAERGALFGFVVCPVMSPPCAVVA